MVVIKLVSQGVANLFGVNVVSKGGTVIAKPKKKEDDFEDKMLDPLTLHMVQSLVERDKRYQDSKTTTVKNKIKQVGVFLGASETEIQEILDTVPNHIIDRLYTVDNAKFVSSIESKLNAIRTKA